MNVKREEGVKITHILYISCHAVLIRYTTERRYGQYNKAKSSGIHQTLKIDTGTLKNC
jgi:hypothetical protein